MFVCCVYAPRTLCHASPWCSPSGSAARPASQLEPEKAARQIHPTLTCRIAPYRPNKSYNYPQAHRMSVCRHGRGATCSPGGARACTGKEHAQERAKRLGLATSSAVILKGRFRTKRIRFTCRAQPPREHGDQRAHAPLHTPTNLGGQTGVCTSTECAVHAYQAKCGALQALPLAPLLLRRGSFPASPNHTSKTLFFREPPTAFKGS